MNSHVFYKVTFNRGFLLAVIGNIAIVAPIAIAQPLASLAAPQVAKSQVNSIAFDVVSIKRNNSGSPSGQLSLTDAGNGFFATNVTMRRIVEFAFNFRRDDLVLQAPNWARSERYDVVAKIAGPDMVAYHNFSDSQRRVMLQAVFADRCKMQAHQERKEMPIYTLMVTKTGSMMKEAKIGDTYLDSPDGPDGQPIRREGLFHLGATQLVGHATPISELALALSGEASGRQVIDQTGLQGKYDFMLHWTPELSFESEAQSPNSPPSSASSSESLLPSLFSAVQEQLGLKLNSGKGPVDVLMIDRLERPSEN